MIFIVSDSRNTWNNCWQVLVAVVLCTTGTLSAPQRPVGGGSDKDAIITSQQLEVGFDGNYINK